MQSLPFDKPGRFWKGNIHTHSSLTDGVLSPEAVCAAYRAAGYDFLSITDHFLPAYNFPLVDTRSFRTTDFTTILGAELHAGALENGEIWHIVAVGLPLDFAPATLQETGPQIAQRALDAGAFVGIAHPNWYNLSQADALSLGDVHAVEIFNGVAAELNDKPDSLHLLDILSDRGYRYLAYAADDAHRIEDGSDFQQGWVHVKSESLEPGALTAALKAGHFYSSTGPEIQDIHIESNQLGVQCSPVDRIFVIGHGSKAQRAQGDGITEAVFDLTQFDNMWCRVIVRCGDGRRAWSNPIWLD